MNQKDNEKKINTVMDTYLYSRKYDLRRIDCEHPLWQNISKKIKINANDGNEEIVDTYLEYAGVVFDDCSYNFHIFPKNKKIYKALSEEFVALREGIINGLKKKIEATNKGSGRFTLFQNVERIVGVVPENKMSENNIYQYVNVEREGVSYTLNFMRYTCDEQGKIGCTMRAIQFHKSRGYINKANGFNICYTINDEDEKYESIKYNIVKKKKEDHCENVCYNPPVDWPNAQAFDVGATTYKFEEDTINKIIDYFLDFIEKEGKIC